MSTVSQSQTSRSEHGYEVRRPPQSFGGDVKEVEFGAFDHSGIPLDEEEWPVAIIGSSMVGMMTGILLGYHGYGYKQAHAEIAPDWTSASKAYLSIGIRPPAHTQGPRG